MSAAGSHASIVHSLALKSVPEPTYTGLWYIVQSTLPFWSDKKSPRINYVPVKRESGPVQYEDVATFLEKGFFSSHWEEKKVVGIDTQHPSIPTAYEWRGPGWMKILSCEWSFIACQPSSYAVLLFGKTLVTPEGLDILFRSPKPSAQELDAVTEALNAIPQIQHLRQHIKFTAQDPVE